MRRPALALLLGCLLLVAGASALDGYDYYQTIEYAGCDQDIYQQDIVIHRSTGTAYNETAGGLETWHIFVGDHCQADYDDIRFTNSTGELAYYLWPDYDSSSARFAVRLEGADAAGEVTAWYGSAAGTTTSNGSATYEFFNDGSSLEGFTTLGTVAVEDGRIYLNSASAQILTTAEFGTNITVEYSIQNSASNRIQSGLYSDDFSMQQWFWDNHRYLFRSFLNGVQVDSDEDSNAYTSNPLACRITRIGDISVKAEISGGDTFIQSSLGADPCAFAVNLYSTSFGKTYVWDVRVRTYSAAPPAASTFSGEQETAAPPVTTFTATPTAGLAPLTVQFTDTSAGHPTSWLWDFGDGDTSTEQNPQHTYTVPGTYTVTLTATNEYGSDYELKADYITVYAPVTAQFSATPTSGTAPLTVQFTDLSTGGPTSWLWDFGDGGTSTEQNPQHTYTTAGAHTVTLTASHPYDSDTETKTAYITVAVLQPFPGLANIPRDLTGNGLYTDINGNNRLDYNDLTIFFQNLAWAKTAQPIACFDFNGNGWLDYNDVITLFSIIMEEHT